ncbi:hypothetical protein ACTWKD_05660 [Halanaerobium saccharolyticum]|uniref:Uncharacterized protein n=1 Tax=Halanaerobium saccharolyticum TaxID=43595 RepID=A0A2T5RSR5_9FIRM|nr:MULTISPECIES: hypothetical protein [Halanaerobium]PTW03368.1 hypothetical protein C8C76_1013 [Halanaerobium saccharolyticum]PUU89859.1 MAG: hypothetical protein CI949_2563 [Halanaerobium sp.]PUU95692.1 MAG: hypothetical protein CI947_109 [Halanaerobium sp.]TDP95962.1 hypothetical protein C7957_10847 [Halanaerobium saccharolyticum]
MPKTIKLISIFAAVELVLHGIWEYTACGIFYTMEGQGFIEHQLLMIQATIGDVFIALGLFFILAFVNQRSNWFLGDWERKDYIISLLYSVLVAFYFEAHALHLGRWGYQENMPLVYGTSIALVPVIQLSLLLPLGFVLTKKIYHWKFT